MHTSDPAANDTKLDLALTKGRKKRRTFLVICGPVRVPVVEPTKRIAFVRSFFVWPAMVGLASPIFDKKAAAGISIPAVFSDTILKVRM